MTMPGATGAGRANARHQSDPGPPLFRSVTDVHFVLTYADLGIEFHIDRLRRERHELIGELSVSCGMIGARTIDGCLSIGTFNVSSTRARQERAKALVERARTSELDWLGMLEELCQRVLAAERAGQPAVLLHTLPKPNPDDMFDVEAIRLLKAHPVVMFGDGGGAKSYLALYLAGQMAQRKLHVLYADWELAGDDHRDRLERLYGSEMPHIYYARCERPMVVEADRLRRLTLQHRSDYLICDSVAFACAGPPEAAEVAAEYFRAVRQIGVGSLHVAHITKGENGDQKPFGSSFWHNGARATWFVKLASTSTDGQQITIGLFNRKANLGPLRPAVGFEITFEATRTRFARVDLATVDELADRLPIWQRMRHALADGPMTLAALADELKIKVESIERAARRGKNKMFTRIEGANGEGDRIALIDRRWSV